MGETVGCHMIRVLDSAGSTLVEWGRQQQQQHHSWHSVCPEYAKEKFLVVTFESSFKVYDVDVQASLSLSVLFMKLCRTKFWSKFCYSFLIFLSTAFMNCMMMILTSILLGTDRTVIPFQLLQLLMAPFIEIFTITLTDSFFFILDGFRELLNNFCYNS